MARPLCIEFENAFYHVMSRGLNRQNLFNDSEDFKFFLYLLNQAKEKYQFICHSYCCMHNHYHLYLQTPQPNLSKIMKFLNESYARYFLSKYPDKDGHVFKGRYKRKIVQSDQYSLNLSRYIHLNPVKAKLVDHPHQWQWSSYNAFVGQGIKHHFLEINWLLQQFDKDHKKAQKLIAKFTYEDLISSWDPQDHTIAKLVLGSKDFFDHIVKNYVNQNDLSEDVLAYSEFRIAKNLEPDFILSRIKELELTGSLKTKLLIYFLKEHSKLSLRQIGAIVNKKAKAVDKAYSRIKPLMTNGAELSQWADLFVVI